MVAKGEQLHQLVAETLEAVDSFEQEHHPRIRARHTDARESHEALVHALVVNLAHSALAPSPTGRFAIQAGNPKKGAGRYNNPAFGKGVRPLLELMHEMGILDFQLPGTMRGEMSSIAPTASFAERVLGLGITLDDFEFDEREEVLILTRKAGTRAAPSTDRIDYVETPETQALRDAVRKVNAFIAEGDIGFVADGLSPIIDPRDRLLKRRFVLLKGDDEAHPRFDRGGRLFGGFWINLASTRRGNIRIEGEHIADLDYASMFARLAYAAIGVTPPDGDVYAVPGLEGSHYRSGIKLAFNIFLFDSKKRREAWPKSDMGVGVGDDAEAKANPSGPAANFEGLLPAGWENPERLRTAILSRHPALEGAFGRRLGYGLMFTESRVLLAVMGELMRRNIVALPLHDGLMVAQSKRDEALTVMREVVLEVTGAAIPADEKMVG